MRCHAAIDGAAPCRVYAAAPLRADVTPCADYAITPMLRHGAAACYAYACHIICRFAAPMPTLMRRLAIDASFTLIYYALLLMFCRLR